MKHNTKEETFQMIEQLASHLEVLCDEIEQAELSPWQTTMMYDVMSNCLNGVMNCRRTARAGTK